MRFLALPLMLSFCMVAAASDSRPVLVGGEVSLDACGGGGKIGGAKSGLISVRAGPGANFAEVDRLRNGVWVSLCDFDKGWHGVVYATAENVDCGVGSPIPKRAPYRGACKSGWIRGKWITDIVG
jgi:hypothetical protein